MSIFSNNRKTFGIAGLSVAVLLLLKCWFLWQPENQVRLHQKHLLQAVEDRNWSRFARFISEKYSDRWQHDKRFVTQEPREVFQQFIWLTLKAEERGLRMEGSAATVRSRLVFAGNGGPLADLVKQRVNGLAEPFTFRWEKPSWKPWDWQLVRFDQPELEMPDL